MKKAVFLLALFLAIANVSSCLASSSTQDPLVFDTYEVTCSLWDIPWYCSPEEFLSSVKDKQGLTFIPTEDLGRYDLSAPADFRFFGEPVKKCMAYFTASLNGMDDGYVSPPIDPSDLEWLSTVFYFYSPCEKTAGTDAIAAFARLYDNLFAQYGPPLSSYLWIRPHTTSEIHTFSFPIANYSVDQSAAMQLLIEPYTLVGFVAHFAGFTLSLAGQPAIDPDSFELRLRIRAHQTIYPGLYPPYTVDVEFE